MNKEMMRDFIRYGVSQAKQPMDIFSFFPYERSKKEIPIKNLILEGARNGGHDLYSAMDNWLDWLLQIFDSEHYSKGSFQENLEERKKENPQWYEALCRWGDETKREKCTDFFGKVYEEEFKSSGKAKVLGQFFTPTHVADLCARVAYNPTMENIVVNDCACGSGRMLLGAYTAHKEEIKNDTKFNFFFGGDIDGTSVKMCALNLMINGLQGIVVNQDALMLSKPRYGYLINPTNAPIRTGILSVQYLDSDKCASFIDWQDEQGVHSNLSKWLSLYKWQWNVAHEKEEPKDIEIVEVKEEKPRIRKEPIQLSLFD